MSKSKIVSYAGVPAKMRKQVANVRRSGAWVLLPGKPQTPQAVWAAMEKQWADDEAIKAKKKVENEQRLAEVTRKSAIGALIPALGRLASCRDVVGAIEDNLESMSYVCYQELAGFVKLAIEDAGAELEQSLCDLGLVREAEYGFFVDNLKSEGVKMEPIPEEEEEEETQ